MAVDSQVGTHRIELHLDEAPNRALTLGSGYSLQITTATGTSSTLGLGAFNGGQLGNVPGIKVEAGFMGDIRSAPSEVRLKGSRNRASGFLVIIPLFTKDVVDDRALRPAAGRSPGHGQQLHGEWYARQSFGRRAPAALLGRVGAARY